VPCVPAQQLQHPNEKPVNAIAPLIACHPVCKIVDPFMGSGSTLIAARSLNRPAVGIEIEERYCEIAAKRLSQEVMQFGGASCAGPVSVQPTAGNKAAHAEIK
jgi:site-specific DNA-methyltransferase (adenine-specific)